MQIALNNTAGKWYGTRSQPAIGDITIDATGQVESGTALVFHSDTIEPTLST